MLSIVMLHEITIISRNKTLFFLYFLCPYNITARKSSKSMLHFHYLLLFMLSVIAKKCMTEVQNCSKPTLILQSTDKVIITESNQLITSINQNKLHNLMISFIYLQILKILCNFQIHILIPLNEI